MDASVQICFLHLDDRCAEFQNKIHWFNLAGLHLIKNIYFISVTVIWKIWMKVWVKIHKDDHFYFLNKTQSGFLPLYFSIFLFEQFRLHIIIELWYINSGKVHEPAMDGWIIKSSLCGFSTLTAPLRISLWYSLFF